jgi:hypothetical protein
MHVCLSNNFQSILETVCFFPERLEIDGFREAYSRLFGNVAASVVFFQKFWKKMEPEEFQKLFFQRISDLRGTEMSIEMIGQVLGINKSSVYNRLSGKQLLRLDELKNLAEHFDIPIQELIPKAAEHVGFVFPTMTKKVESCTAFLNTIYDTLKYLSSAPDMRIWNSSTEMPFFQYQNFRALGLFKLFAWARINWRIPYLEDAVFHPDTFQEAHVYDQLSQPILHLYNKIPTVDIWTPAICDNTLAQLRYFEDSGQMANGVADEIRDQLFQLTKHQYAMAEQGKKWRFGEEPNEHSASYELYINEISPTSITFFTESQHIKMVISVFDNPNFMHSTDPNLYAYTSEWMLKLRQKSTQISLAAEQDRRKFFQHIQHKIKG